jgi:hypothetical protein
MADPRNTIDWEGIGKEAEPFIIDGSTITYDATQVLGSAQVGLAVTLSAAKTVALTADGDAVIGKLLQVESDGKCAVQTEGWCQLPGGTGATLTLGTKVVGALLVAAKGYIRTAASGTATELVKARGVIGDAGTPSATWVRF